ncbi:MAG: hypothetical protein ACQEWU_03185 [Bacillota bacterium]
MSIKAAVLLHASVVEPDNSEGRPLQLLWEMFDLRSTFLSGFC